MSSSSALRYPPPETRRAGGVDILREFLPARIAGPEQCAGHPPVFGRIECSSCASQNAVERLEQPLQRGTLVGKVERERNARARKREHPGRGHGAEPLQHREKRALPAAGDGFEQFHGRLAGVGRRHYTLVLIEALRAIQPVPMEKAIERKKEGPKVVARAPPASELPVIVEGVEYTQRQAVDERHGWWKRHRPVSLGGSYCAGPLLSMIRALQDAPAEPFAAAQTVDPSHRIFKIPLRFLTECKEFPDVGEPDALDIEPRAGDASQLQLRPCNDAGQPEPADRSGEPRGILGLRAHGPGTVRA